MAESIKNKIERSLKSAQSLYYRLVLIVGQCGSGKTAVIQNLAKQYNISPLNINLTLSKELLELTEKQRLLKLSEILSKTIEGSDEILFLDNIEILFDVGLKQDPLKLLQGLSRNLKVVASWNGIFNNGKLTYAEPSHREYKSYDLTDTLVVSMDGDATIDFKNTSEDNLV